MRGRVALALAAGVALFVVLMGAGLFFTLARESTTLTDAETQLVTGVVAGIVGALAVYLGGTAAEGRDQRRDPPPPDDDLEP